MNEPEPRHMPTVPLDFPDNPALDEIYQTWRWDGEKWVALTGREFPPPPDDP